MSKGIALIAEIGSTARFSEQQVINLVDNPNSSSIREPNSHKALDSAVHQAILDKDNQKLNKLLGVRGKIYCAMLAPKDNSDDFADELDEELKVADCA